MLSVHFLVYVPSLARPLPASPASPFALPVYSTDRPPRTIWTFHPRFCPLPGQPFLSLCKRVSPLIRASADCSALLPGCLVLASILAFTPLSCTTSALPRRLCTPSKWRRILAIGIVPGRYSINPLPPSFRSALEYFLWLPLQMHL